MALENARLYETARNLADRDPLTGFFNHRYLHERLSEEVVRAVRTRRPLSVVMLDLDDFKLVNDTFGHVYGDGVLVHVAELIRGALRASDVAARYGGDEFALDPPRDRARGRGRRVAERILAAFAASPFVGRTAASRSRSAASIGHRDPPARRLLRDRRSSRPPTSACTTRRTCGGNRFAAGTATRDVAARGRLEGSTTGGRGRARRGRRRADRGGCGAVRGGLSGYGSTRTPPPPVLAAALAARRASVPCLVPG